MTEEDLDRIKTVLSASGSIDILLLASSGPCSKTEVYRMLSGSTHILDTLDLLEQNDLISIDSQGDDVFVALTFRGSMILDLLRWAETLLRT